MGDIINQDISVFDKTWKSYVNNITTMIRTYFIYYMFEHYYYYSVEKLFNNMTLF